MLQELIASKVRVKLLTLFLTHPDAEYHLKGLVGELGENNNTLRRELKRLEGIGLLSSRREGNLKLYRVNPNHLLYNELKRIVFKTTGVGQALWDALNELSQIDFALIYGSFAKGDERAASDLDLFIVGEVGLNKLRDVLHALERRLGREINETVYGSEEFRQRCEESDPFVRRVLDGPRIILIGSDDALP